MAKIKHNHLLDSIDEIITDGIHRGVLHLYTEDESFTGRQIQIKGKRLLHFGTTSYLGLDQDERLKQAAIDGIKRFGLQFPLSKTYLSMGINKVLEDHLLEIYKHPVLVSKNSTLSHIAVIPGITRDEDAIILDHQVHWTVQNACQLVKPRGVHVEIIRHNNMGMLEEKLKAFGNKYNKVWYMVDGVYSMYGDFAPFDELLVLMEKYPQLNLYIDDVHGMSWAGENGSGYVMGKLKTLHKRMVLISTLSKTFGAAGGIAVFGDQELYRKVQTFGGPQTFSAQLEPPMVAAAIASAKIHLSDEIYLMQNELWTKIEYCNKLLASTNLPLVIKNDSPVFYIGIGTPAAGYKLVNRIMDDGFYVNLGIFPAVPVKNTGIRFTISRHNKVEDIEKLIMAINYNYPKVLEEEGKTFNQVRKVFNLPLSEEEAAEVKEDYIFQHFNSIKNINKEEWNSLLGIDTLCDYDGLMLIEETYTNNGKAENNWIFDYFIIRDYFNNPILATFFTTSIWKEDLLAPADKSRQIEEKRKEDYYYLTSLLTGMGTLISEGNTLFIDKKNGNWKPAFKYLLDKLSDLQEKRNSPNLILRDFEDNDEELKAFILDQGFVKVGMPETCIIGDLSWKNFDEYLMTLTHKSRKHVRATAIRYQDYFDISVKNTANEEEISHFYSLYQNVKNRNLDINMFETPVKFFANMSGRKNWEYIVLNIKPEYDTRIDKKSIGVVFCYRNSNNDYIPVSLGMDYDFLEEYQLYRQVIYQIILRAKALETKKVKLGFSACIEKRKFGATIVPKVAYLQAKDNFTLEFIEGMAISKAK